MITNYIEDNNLSRAWARAFLQTWNVRQVAPLIVTINVENGIVSEDDGLRIVLDAALDGKDEFSCQTVASTIFPQSIWNPAHPRALLYERYMKLWPKIRKKRQNIFGTYFHRMISYGSDGVNQIENLLAAREGGLKRRSAFQIAIYDPAKDFSTAPQRGFPCLQQIAVAPEGKVGLSITGFYPMQHTFPKAYGNYLGLANVGVFLAHEMGRRLSRVTCVSSIAVFEGTKKSLANVYEVAVRSAGASVDGH